MLRLWAFAPTLLVLVGAILAAGGTFWSGLRQYNFNAELRTRDSEIKKLQEDSIRTLKGADFCRFMIVYTPTGVGTFPLFTVNNADLPAYDVYVVIRSHVDHPWDTPEHQAEAMHYIENPMTVEIGTVLSGVKQTHIFLEPGYYQIDIRTRYHRYTQMLKFGAFDNGMGQSYIVSDFTGKIFEKQTSPDGFPKIYKDD